MNRLLKWGPIGSFMTAVLLCITFWGSIKNNVLYPFLDEWNKGRKGGFRTEIAKGLGKESDDISDYLIAIIKTSENTIEVGIIVKRDNPKKYLFVNIDGQEYPATRGEDGEWYYWDEEATGTNKWFRCF